MAISKGKFEGLTRVSYKGEICTVKVYEKGICETEDGHLLKLGQAQYERFLEAQKKIQEQAREEEQSVEIRPTAPDVETPANKKQQTKKARESVPEDNTSSVNEASKSILSNILNEANTSETTATAPSEESVPKKDERKGFAKRHKENATEQKTAPVHQPEPKPEPQNTSDEENYEEYEDDGDIELLGGTTSSQLANVTTVTPIAAPQYAPVKFVSDNETSYRPAAQDIKSFDAVVYLSSVYDKFAHKGAVAYYIVPRGNEKKLIRAESGFTDNEFEYAIHGATMMFKDVMSNGIRQVIVVANNALTRDVLVQNAMNIQDSWGETREAYVSFMRKYSGIAFVPKFAVDSKETRGKVPYMDIVNGLAKSVLRT
jgi:hypothetical protein